MSIEVHHLTKQYDSQTAVNNISFEINKSEVVGFLGPNGAGKSTTLKIITGYIKATSGIAKVCGIDVNENPIGVKNNIGYLPEANPLHHELYVKEYLQFIAGLHKIKNSRIQIERVIDLTGLTGASNKKIGQLSKGYKQRVGIAAALIHDPAVIILDEPTSGLDPNQIVEIRNVIKEQGNNKSVLFSSHILQEVQAICDRVIIINRGVIVADDKLENLHRNNASNIVKVSFAENVPISDLKNLQFVNEVKLLKDSSFTLASNNTDEVKRQLLQLALSNGLNITSLQTEGSNLESIFRSLTVENSAKKIINN